MTLRVRIAWTDRSDQALMKLAGWSAITHLAALVVFSLLPRFAEPAPAPRAIIAEIVPMSALFPGPRPGPSPSGPTPSQRADAAREALKPKAPALDKPAAPEPKKRAARPETLSRPRKDAGVPPLTPPPKDAPKEPSDDTVEEAAGGGGTPSGELPEAPGPETSGGVTFGSSGAPGGIPSIGSSAFPYDYYRSSLVGVLRSNWRRPVAPDGLSEPLSCSVQFTILKSGIIQSPAIARRSGNEALDQSALRAVYDSNPLPPLPFQYGHASVSAEVVFELTAD